MLIVSTQNFPPEIGGIGNLIYSLCTELAARGEKLMVYTDPPRSSSVAAFDNAQKFKILRYSGLKPTRRRKKARDIYQHALNNLPSSPKLITDSWKSLELVNCDIFSNVLCLAHGSEIPPESSRFKLKRVCRAYSKAEFIVANSFYTANLVRPYTDNPEKVRVITPGINIPEIDADLERVTEKALGHYSPILITIARLEKRKGQRQVINVLPELIKLFPSLLYIIVGEGNERIPLEITAKELGVDRHVRFTGMLEGPEKNAYLARSDLYVMPGSVIGQDVEGFGMAYIEAGYFGIPSIACRAGGAPEAVIHNETGLLSDPGNPGQLRDNIITMLKNIEMRQHLGSNARIRSHEFLWESKITEYRQLLAD